MALTSDPNRNAPRSDPAFAGREGQSSSSSRPAAPAAICFRPKRWPSRLQKRGATIDLATDTRAAHFKFPARAVHLIPSATLRGAQSALARAHRGAAGARHRESLDPDRPHPPGRRGRLRRLSDRAAAARREPARRADACCTSRTASWAAPTGCLPSRVTTIATGFPHACQSLDPRLQGKDHFTGNPVRPQVIAAAATPYAAPAPNGPFRLLVFGGSQGARVMAEIVPAAIERLERRSARAACRSCSRRAPRTSTPCARPMRGSASPPNARRSFADLPARMAAAHLVVSRSGASTVAELSAIGRPAILVPLPHALDQDQFANAGVLADGGRRDPHRAARFHARAAGRRDRRAWPPIRRGLPAWRRRPNRPAPSTPPSGWRMWS